MKTLNDLFILDCMKGSTVLAGGEGLDNEVVFATVSDTPDIIDYLNNHDLLLTTGYAFKDDTEKLCDLIKQMHSLNCAGIFIKINRFLKELPVTVKQLADELHFPIINLHPSSSLGDVSRHILNYLNDHELEELYYALHMHEEFSEMMYKGYNLAYLVEQLGYFLKRPTILLNHRAEKIAQSHDFQKDSLKLMEQEITKMIKEDITASREGKTFYIPSNKHQAITSFPIKTLREHNSMIVIIDSSTIPYPSSQIAIEQAGNIISFTIIKEQAINENTRILKNNFFSDLIDQRIQADKEVLNRAKFYGLEKNMNSICITCKIEFQEQEYSSLFLYERKVGELHNAVYEQLEDEIVDLNINKTLFTRESNHVLILQFKEYTKGKINKVKRFIKNTQKNLNKVSEYTVSFGISNPIKKLTAISTAYHESIEAIQNGHDQGKTGFINFYKARELKELLSILPKKDLKALYESTLQSLAYPVTEENIELVKTIKTYLDFQCNISETARHLFVHRNTVKYRIEKSEEILNRSLMNPYDSLRIRTALMIGSILQDDQAINKSM